MHIGLLFCLMPLLPIQSSPVQNGACSSESRLIPAFTAYIEPDPDGAKVSEPEGIRQWSDARQKVVWYGKINAPGRLELSLKLRLPPGEQVRLRLTIAGKTRTASVTGEGAQPITATFQYVEIPAPGYYRIALEGLSKTGQTFGDLESLRLSGPAARSAHFSLVERRNASSVHLGYPVAREEKIVLFYNEVTARTDPLWSYYMACGFHRGYFGIQVNSPTERRIIFSVWDSGSEAIDRSKVAEENRVKLLQKGEGVYAGSFGNEGTGGHSHLKYYWKKGETYRFLVAAQPDGTATIYTAFFYFPERKRWGLIASFRAPRDGGYLRGLYSFNENFWGSNGQMRRLAEFGNPWIRKEDGTWQELLTARFTHDPHGKEQRKDYDAGVRQRRFYLSNGGFLDGNIRYGETITRPPSNRPPVGSLPPIIP
jgi:hypothetical protein